MGQRREILPVLAQDIRQAVEKMDIDFEKLQRAPR